MASAGKSISRFFVWIILGLLFVALAGFGIGSFGGGASRVGQVGDAEITAQDYARALQNEIRARIAQTQAPVNLADLRAQGIDEAVLQSLVARAALANEAAAMGLSVGDAEVARAIQGIEAFQGVDGSFDRESYEFVLAQEGLGPRDFEEDVREDTARALLQSAVVGGIRPPEAYAEAIAAFEGETRDLSILTLTESDLAEPVPAPSPEELAAYYDENPGRFERPEARRITYAWVTPSAIMDSVEVDEDTLRRLYDDRIDLYRQPERRLLERLAFGSEADAQAAFDAIAAGETDFDTLVAERDLTLDDVDLGEVGRGDLPGAAAEAIFADTESEILGPLPSPLGPALYRVNAVLEATETSFEEAREELREELADEAARRTIADMREEIDDLLASGATLEELADTTEMEIGQIDFTAASEEDIAAYDAFRAAAASVSDRDFPEVLDLSDGGIFALRLDEIVPPFVPPLAEIEDEVAQAWRFTAVRTAVAARADELVGQLRTRWSMPRLAADLDTPVSLMLKLAAARDAFMLESVTGGEVRGRYSIIGMKPDLIWRCRGGRRPRSTAQARFDADAFEPRGAPPLDSLRALIAESRIDLPADLPQAAAGLFGYLGYDMIRLVEHLPDVNPDPLGLPDAVMMRPSVVAVLDGVKGEVTVVAPAWVSAACRPARGLCAGRRAGDGRGARSRTRACPADRAPGRGGGRPAEPVSNFTTRWPIWRGEKRAKEYIRAGDIFQVVPSQRWTQAFPLPPFALYRALRRTNPSPFMFYFNFGGFQVIGASPEILVRVFGGEVTIRPIAGTRPRGATPEEDRALEADLLADEKELAEHLMLLDLGRNDVGRVAKIGTVRPTEEFIIERYSHVMHIVSNVVGELPRSTTRCRRCWRGCPRARSRARPRCARWRSSTSWSRKSAASMAAAWAISAPAATWTCASRCAPRW
jgi:peptidyl-prolyl cis-trans isomerase D